MSSEIAIDIMGLGKRFEIDRSDTPTRFTERLMSRRPSRRQREAVWALREVDLEIAHGEVVGLIGRNGAGKSTLLKILTRVTAPTEGRVILTGRVGSLLEVGTGFHPELSGRENIYMNGALLGMSRRDVGSAFDSIVEFAGVERFIDVPVKRYSSGMYMRLAFSVAAHLDTEILLVDEVLAVGDAEFQNRSLGRMQEAADGGRTVVFVSHNMSAMTQLCTRCAWIDGGRLRRIGPTEDVVREYLGVDSAGTAHAVFDDDPHRPVQFRQLEILANGERTSTFEQRSDIDVVAEVIVRARTPGLFLALALRTPLAGTVFLTDVRDTRPDFSLPPGSHGVAIKIPGGVLAPGTYSVTVGAATTYEGRIDHREAACTFEVYDHESARSTRAGVLGLRLPWQLTIGGQP